MANNLQKLPEGARKVIANSPALLDFMVAACEQKREDLVDEVRAATSIDEAQEIAKEKNAVSVLDAVPGKTVNDVYTVTGTDKFGPENICGKALCWDPITETCVPCSYETGV